MAKQRTKKRPRRTSKTYSVFVSHATEDKWIAVKFCEAIADAGVDTFRDDRDISGGDDIPEEVRRAIASSAEMVVLMTPQSQGRPWVLVEVGAAWQLKRRITVVLYHLDVATLPPNITNRKAFRLNDVDRLVREIAARAQKAK